MIDNHILATVLIQLFTAILQLVFWQKTLTQRILSVLGSTLAVCFSIELFSKVFTGETLVMNAAGWQAPFGIVFVADLFSSTLVVLTSLAGLAISLFSCVGISKPRLDYGYFPVFHFLIMGLTGAFLTGDIFNLYVWFEVIIIASFVLMTLGGRKTQLEGSVKYMALNILASTFFLTGIALLYGLTGTLNMADLAVKIREIDNPYLIEFAAIFFLLGFGTKSAIFPLYYWLPSSYHTPPSAVAATFGGLLTKVGVYAMFRVFTLIIPPSQFMQNILLFLAALTVLTGIFGMVNKRNIRKLFSYLIICHIGFMIGGLALFTKTAFLGGITYLIHDIIVKTNLFLVAGLMSFMRGSANYDNLGGLYKDYPKISLIIAVVLFSLVGVPPLSGFWPKIYLFGASLDANAYLFFCALILGSFFTLSVVIKLWSEAFWKEPKNREKLVDKFTVLPSKKKVFLILPIGLLAGISLMIGLNIEFVIQVADRISDELLDSSSYIQTVLK
ncbi:MAG TPA: proton-conducting transporter membrane subunit [Sphingobacterium sp.]|nr:proton-conducting transporter membrane subunit [Sphingobacterium sp.]